MPSREEVAGGQDGRARATDDEDHRADGLGDADSQPFVHVCRPFGRPESAPPCRYRPTTADCTERGFGRRGHRHPVEPCLGPLPARVTRKARRYDWRVRRYFTPRCIAMHITLLVLLPAFAFLTKWQLDRALGGNTLSWAYTFEWPLFAGYAVYVWWQLIHDNSTAVTRRWANKGPPRPRDGSSTARRPKTEPGRAEDGALEPGWALTGGRQRNVAIAAATAVDAERGGRGERYTLQTEEEAEQLAAYNRYLAELAADEARTRRR